MSNYNKSVNFAVKDTLQSGDPNKIVSGAEIDNEFNNISSSSSTKIDKVAGAGAGNIPSLTATGAIEDSGQPLNTFVPTATILMYGANTAPSGWLICNGSELSRSQYSDLFGLIGTQYGAGNGSTTFNLPDLRDRFPVGQGAMGGFQANRINNFDTDTGDTGGADQHVLTEAEMPSHNHNAIVFNGGGGPLTGNVQGTFGGPDFGPLVAGNATQSAGSNFPHNNIPPFQAVNFIIKT